MTTKNRRGSSFDELAVALGLSVAGLRRWARKDDGIKGAYKVRGKWILRGPLSQKRIDDIRKRLKLNPEIQKGRQGIRHLPPVAPPRPSYAEKEISKWNKQFQKDLQTKEDLDSAYLVHGRWTPEQQSVYDNTINRIMKARPWLSDTPQKE